MAGSIILPLLVSAASNHLQSVGNGGHYVSDTREWQERKQEGNKEWRNKIAEWRKRNDEQLWKWMKEGPMGGGETNQGWTDLLQEWKETPTEDHKIWEETAWKLLRNWTEDDSLSSLLGWEAQKQSPMIHITSRYTVNNETEEKTTMVPSSSLTPLLNHMFSSPMFLHYVPIILLGIIPLFFMMFLMPLFIMPILLAVFAIPMIFGLAFLPFGMLGTGALKHVVTWLAHQDVQAVIEKTGMEDLESLIDSASEDDQDYFEDTLSSSETTLTPNFDDNTVSLTEVPRLLRW